MVTVNQTTVPATVLRQKMADYLKLVQEGEEVVVLKYGKVIAKLVSPEIPEGE